MVRSSSVTGVSKRWITNAIQTGFLYSFKHNQSSNQNVIITPGYPEQTSQDYGLKASVE